MLTRNSLLHGLRRDQLLEVLEISELPIVPIASPFVHPETSGIAPITFNIDELHVAISPISDLNFDWSWAPVDTILIEVIIPPVDFERVKAEDTFLRYSGMGYIQCEPGGASITRTVTFVGGTTIDNLLHQLKMMCVSALHLLGEDLDE
ncbi:transfer repressor [Lelliottia amnigena]|uniref:transfer repressor n=1 Tax=Lelliottia TaxID=1330545 RepID=UPI00192BD11A|nr:MULTISPECIES: transfer repressor [Lelliottia]MBL5885676.1 transfer repressor [Lelliottia aquatilis]MBL5923254.1 transfer repressor [Lelliottia amnigena]MBL5932164.1 transfer repressor [Lelliottia amnigena]